MSGYIAGVFCAVVSHPADTIVSKLNAVKGTDTLGNNLKKFIEILDSWDFGVVYWQEFLWLVLLQVFNGGFMIHSKLQ